MEYAFKILKFVQTRRLCGHRRQQNSIRYAENHKNGLRSLQRSSAIFK